MTREPANSATVVRLIRNLHRLPAMPQQTLKDRGGFREVPVGVTDLAERLELSSTIYLGWYFPGVSRHGRLIPWCGAGPAEDD
jgi:hypothetical protein